MAHRSNGRNIYEEKLKNSQVDTAGYLTLLYSSPYRQHKLKAARIEEQRKMVEKMQGVVDKVQAEEVTEA